LLFLSHAQSVPLAFGVDNQMRSFQDGCWDVILSWKNQR